MRFVGRVFGLLKSRKVLLFIGIFIVLYFIFLRGGADESKIKTTNVRRDTVSSEVSGSGAVRATSSANIRFAVAGKVVSVPVKEGDFVNKGQVIASLDREKYEIALRQANQDVVAADAELEKVYDSSKKDNTETFDEKILRTSVEAKKNKAFDNMKAAQRNLKDSTLTAPISGKIVAFHVKPLEEIFPTTDIATIVDDGAGSEFEVEVDETEISKLRVGQKVKIVLDAFEDHEIESEVASVGAVSVLTSTGATAYEVKMNFPNDDKYKIGMNGEARIITDIAADTLVLSYDSLVDDDFVWVKKSGGWEKVKVTRGLESDLDFEVKEGLAEGAEVVVAGFEEIGKQNRLDKLLNTL